MKNFIFFLLSASLSTLTIIAAIIGFNKTIISIFLDRNIFLEGIKEHRLDGCKLLGRYSSKLLFVGDSHSYSAFDFVTLEKELKPQTLDACLLPGLHVKTFKSLTKHITTVSTKYDVLILNTSPHMFSALNAKKEKRIVKQKEYLKRISNNSFNYALEAIKSMVDINPFRPYSEFDTDVESIDENFILKHSIITDYDKNSSLDFSGEISEICEDLKSLAKHHFINHIPESPILENSYTQDERLAYAANIKSLQKCGFTLLDYNFPNKNKYYFNREAQLEAAKEILLGKITANNKKYLIDFDHMNNYGSKVYTQWWLSIFKESEIIANDL